MRKNIIIIIIIVIIALAIWLWQSQREVSAPGTVGDVILPVEGDTTDVINQQLQSIDISDLEAEFQAIDSDLKNL